MNPSIIAVSTTKGLTFFNQNKVIYCSSEGAYTRIHLSDGQCILISKNLKEVTNKLTKNLFFRIHHSFLININHVISFKNNKENYVVMDNGQTLPVSRNRKKGFIGKFVKI